jgi:hypothetical protein
LKTQSASPLSEERVRLKHSQPFIPSPLPQSNDNITGFHEFEPLLRLTVRERLHILLIYVTSFVSRVILDFMTNGIFAFGWSWNLLPLLQVPRS